MGLQADVFWSFRSPYSYLATRRYRALQEQYDLTINLRPVYPLAVREPDFFERNHPNWLRYTFTDMFRVAQFYDIPFGPPRPDPIVQDVRTRKIAEEQPYIVRLTRLGHAANRCDLRAAKVSPLSSKTASSPVKACQRSMDACGVVGARSRKIRSPA